MGAFAKASREVESRRQRCIVARGMEGFDDEDIAEFVRLAKARKWEVLEENFPAGHLSIKKHAQGTCPCPSGTVGRGVLN